jgi:hypothetical protein
MIGVILMLVVVLSGFCYYRVRSITPVAQNTLESWR